MICLYHLDDDGKCAAAIVKALGKRDEHEDKFFEMNYGFEIPWDQIQKDEIVYIVDFSIEPNQMLNLIERTNNVIWIDHHASAIKKYDNFPLDIFGVRSVKHSGCMLTYLYLVNRVDWIKKSAEELMMMDEIPYLVRFCDDYDMWRFINPDTRAFHAGFGLVPHDPTDVIWANCEAHDLLRILDQGRAILQYRANMMHELIKSYGYEATFEGYKCYVLNQGLISSDDFESIDVKQYDILIGWIFDGTKYSYSLRSRTQDGGPDVSVIAEKYGGGGHPPAAGFSTSDRVV